MATRLQTYQSRQAAIDAEEAKLRLAFAETLKGLVERKRKVSSDISHELAKRDEEDRRKEAHGLCSLATGLIKMSPEVAEQVLEFLKRNPDTPAGNAEAVEWVFAYRKQQREAEEQRQRDATQAKRKQAKQARVKTRTASAGTDEAAAVSTTVELDLDM